MKKLMLLFVGALITIAGIIILGSYFYERLYF